MYCHFISPTCLQRDKYRIAYIRHTGKHVLYKCQ